MAKKLKYFHEQVDEVLSGQKKEKVTYIQKTKKLTGGTIKIKERNVSFWYNWLLGLRTRHSVERGCNSSHKQVHNSTFKVIYFIRFTIN
jgi:hypothetical protein